MGWEVGFRIAGQLERNIIDLLQNYVAKARCPRPAHYCLRAQVTSTKTFEH
jgi:hypothetical protein